MSETNKLSFLSGQLDAKKSELSSLFGKKKEEPKAEPEVETPAHIRVKAEIEALDRMALHEREAYAKNALKMIEECEKNAQKAGDVYEALETALYLVDDEETIKSVAQLMYEIMWGDLGKKCFITGVYNAEAAACNIAAGMTESAAGEECVSLLTMVYALLDYYKKILERLDSVRNILDKNAYNELCDYYEILFENLGENLQRVQACVLGQDADLVYTRHMPSLMLQKNRKLFEVYRDLAEGCSDWKRGCIASAYSQYLRGTTYGNNIAAIYSGEVLFLADVQNCHYAKRSAEKFERHLENEGCITVSKKATGNFAGEMGSRLRMAESTFDKYSKREKLGTGATICMVLGCLLLLGLAAILLFSKPEIKWLQDMKFIQFIILVLVCALFGASIGEHGGLRGSITAAIIFIVGAILRNFVNFGETRHARIFMLLGLAAAIVQAIRSRIIYDRYKNGARMGFLKDHLKELEECEDCAQTMLETAKKTGSVGLINYYTAVLETASGFKKKYEKVLK